MSVAASGVATAIGLGAIMIIYRSLGIDQMERVFHKKELRDKYDYIVGNLLRAIINSSIEMQLFFVQIDLLFDTKLLCLDISLFLLSNVYEFI